MIKLGIENTSFGGTDVALFYQLVKLDWAWDEEAHFPQLCSSLPYYEAVAVARG